jgi:hypothetical protein
VGPRTRWEPRRSVTAGGACGAWLEVRDVACGADSGRRARTGAGVPVQSGKAVVLVTLCRWVRAAPGPTCPWAVALAEHGDSISADSAPLQTDTRLAYGQQCLPNPACSDRLFLHTLPRWGHEFWAPVSSCSRDLYGRVQVLVYLGGNSATTGHWDNNG